MQPSRVLLGALLLTSALLACAALDTPTADASATVAQPVAVLQEAELQTEFARFTRSFNRTYGAGSLEFNRRYGVFKANVQRIRAHNAAAARGERTYTMAVNQFADMSDEEFRARLEPQRQLFRRAMAERAAAAPAVAAASEEDSPASRRLLQTLPTSVDWEAAGKVTPVQNQGSCGSDYAFASVDAVSSMKAIATSSAPVTLSYQQILDCSAPQGNQGCNGGLPDQTFMYMVVNPMQTASAYPYFASVGTCQQGSGSVGAISGFTVPSATEAALQAAVALRPVFVAIDSSSGKDMHFYSDGVFSCHVASCASSNLDISLLAVGYGYDAPSGLNFWKLKLAWGTVWGEDGYIRMQRGIGMNGIGSYSIYPY